MMNVLINAQPMTVVGTGIGRYLRGLSAAFEAEHRGSVRLSYFTGDGVIDEPPRPRGAGWRERVAQLLWRMPYPVAFGARLLRHAATERSFERACRGFDVYHEAGYFPLRTGGKVRTVMTVHDLSLLRFPQWHPRERVRYAQRYFMDRLPWVDAFCAVSEFTRREMIEFLPVDPEKIRVTPLGYDETLFNETDDPEARTFVRDAGVPEEFILFVGSGDPRKNLDSALAALQAAGISVPLVTVGWSGWHRTGSRVAVNLGYVSDRVLAQLYRSAQLLVMPSEYEGFGLPVLEAMACGCPVVTSGAEALLEVGGDSVISVPDVSDAHAFGAAIKGLVESPETRSFLRLGGLERASLFSWSGTAKGTMSQWGWEKCEASS